MLAQSRNERLYSQIMYYPAIVVNNVTYRGNLEPYEVHELVCSSLLETPA